MFENLNWKKHTGFTIPVHDNAKVIYRTIGTVNGATKVSHIHMPVKASDINWANATGIGRIYKYAVIGMYK